MEYILTVTAVLLLVVIALLIMRGAVESESKGNVRESGLNLGLLADPEYAAPTQVLASEFVANETAYVRCKSTNEVLECKPVQIINDASYARWLTVVRHSTDGVTIYNEVVGPNQHVLFRIGGTVAGYGPFHCYEYYWDNNALQSAGWALGLRTACANVSFGGGGGGGGGVTCDFNISSKDMPYTAAVPGVYCLTEDALLLAGIPITITSSDVELDCQGYRLTGAGPVCGLMQVGVYVGQNGPVSNVEVRNCEIQSFCGALYLANMTSGNVSYNDAHDNYYGIVVAGNGTTYSWNNATSNLFRGFTILSQSFSNIFSNNRACDNNCSGGTCQDFRFNIEQQPVVNNVCDPNGCYQSFGWAMCSSGLAGYSNCAGSCPTDCNEINQANVPYTISAPGKYCLAEDVTNDTNDVITISSSDVEIDCRGHTISGPDLCGAFTNGIYGKTLTNVSIHDCAITKFTTGINLQSTGGFNLTNNVISHVNCLRGMQLKGSAFGIVDNNSIDAEGGYWGIDLSGVHGVNFSDNNITNAQGYGVETGYNNSFEDTFVCGSGEYDFHFYDNQTKFSGSTCGLSKCWQNESFGLCIPDLAAVGADCASQCPCPPGAVANISYCPYNIYCSGTYYLQAPLSCSGKGVTVGALVDDVIIDCLGNSLTGARADRGIGTSLGSNTTVRNCTIANFTDGLDLAGDDYVVEYNTIENNSNYGVEFNGDYLLMATNYFANQIIGAYLFSSEYANVSYNTFTNHAQFGLATNLNMQDNLFSYNNASYNLDHGISVGGSNNTISYNDLVSNGDDGIRILQESVPGEGGVCSHNFLSKNGNAAIAMFVNNTVVSYNNIANNFYGITASSSTTNNSFLYNTLEENEWYGIHLYYSRANLVAHNLIDGGWGVGVGMGVFLEHSNDNVVYNNSLTSNHYGLWDAGDNNTITNNTASGSDQVGVYLNGTIAKLEDNNLCGNLGAYDLYVAVAQASSVNDVCGVNECYQEGGWGMCTVAGPGASNCTGGSVC